MVAAAASVVAVEANGDKGEGGGGTCGALLKNVSDELSCRIPANGSMCESSDGKAWPVHSDACRCSASIGDQAFGGCSRACSRSTVTCKECR
jgi:hypothetical protein